MHTSCLRDTMALSRSLMYCLDHWHTDSTNHTLAWSPCTGTLKTTPEKQKPTRTANTISFTIALVIYISLHFNAVRAKVVLGYCSGNDSRCGHQRGFAQPMAKAACLEGRGGDCGWKPGMMCIIWYLILTKSTHLPIYANVNVLTQRISTLEKNRKNQQEQK